MNYRVLFIAPEDGFRQQVAGRLASAGLRVTFEDAPEEGLRLLTENGADVVVYTAGDDRDLDLAILERMIETSPQTRIILLESGGDVDFALRARRCGVYDDVLIPFDPTELLVKIEAAGNSARSGK